MVLASLVLASAGLARCRTGPNGRLLHHLKRIADSSLTPPGRKREKGKGKSVSVSRLASGSWVICASFNNLDLS